MARSPVATCLTFKPLERRSRDTGLTLWLCPSPCLCLAGLQVEVAAAADLPGQHTDHHTVPEASPAVAPMDLSETETKLAAEGACGCEIGLG